MESDVLFIQPSLLRGVSRTIDLWGKLDDYNFSPSPTEADKLAIASDFVAIGDDLWISIEENTESEEDAE